MTSFKKNVIANSSARTSRSFTIAARSPAACRLTPRANPPCRATSYLKVIGSRENFPEPTQNRHHFRLEQVPFLQLFHHQLHYAIDCFLRRRRIESIADRSPDQFALFPLGGIEIG